MASFLDRDASASFRVRDVSRSFTLSTAEHTPFTTMCPKGARPKSSLYEWPHRSAHTPTDSAIEDGVDVQTSEYINNNSNKAMLQGRVQKGRVAIAVGDLAMELTREYGDGGDNLLAQNRTDALRMARENLEVTLLKNSDSNAESSGTPGKLRGLAFWIRSSNSGVTDTAIPSAALCAAGQIVSGAATAAAVTEDNVRAIMRTIATNKQISGGMGWDVFVTPSMKEVFSNWARTGDITETTVPLRRFNAPADGSTIKLDVRFYEGDFGKARLHTHFSLPSGHHAIFSRMDSVAIRPVRNPRLGALEYRGGAHVEFIEYILGLEVSDPRCHGKITT